MVFFQVANYWILSFKKYMVYTMVFWEYTPLKIVIGTLK